MRIRKKWWYKPVWLSIRDSILFEIEHYFIVAGPDGMKCLTDTNKRALKNLVKGEYTDPQSWYNSEFNYPISNYNSVDYGAIREEFINKMLDLEFDEVLNSI